MESLPTTGGTIGGERLQNMLKSLTKCKIDYLNDKTECKKLREINIKMDLELKEAREIEKSNRYHLQSSREMIESLQETVSQLVYLKRDVKKLKDEIISKDIAIANLKKDSENMQQRHNDSIGEMIKSHESYIEEITLRHEKKIQQVQYDLDTQVAQYTCAVEEMRGRIKDIEEEHRDKTNVVVLEYEEKIQRRTAEVAQLQEQLAMQTARTDANVGAYRRDYLNDKTECKKLREINIKMDLELKEAREIEKSNRYHLQSSREMIESLQETVSQLVYLKRDVKKLKDEIISKDIAIANLKKDSENMQQRHNDSIGEMIKSHESYIEEITLRHEKKIQQVQYDLDTQVAQYTCAVEEMRGRIKDIEEEHRDKTNVVVLEYEEKIQRRTAEVAQLQEQLAMQTARTDANVGAYRRKLEDLEEKLKQNKFKEYLAQNHPSQIENTVERPYSVNRDYSETDIKIASDRTSVYSKQKPALQVMYDTTVLPKNEKKAHFNITKKRKLYSEKDFLNQ